MKAVAFQGRKGAYSDLALRTVFPSGTSLPCDTFAQAFASVREKKAEVAIIPIENNAAGRVIEAHHLLADAGLFIVGEHFQEVEHYWLALPGAKQKELRTVHSHLQALAQCRNFIEETGLTPVQEGDTAGAAAALVESGDKTRSVIASSLAAELYGLQVLRPVIQDHEENVTRFLLFAREALSPSPAIPAITSILFQVRSVPAALYKALGGFASNGVNLTRLESHVSGKGFSVAEFFADFEGRPEDPAVKRAMEELAFFASFSQVLGCYSAHAFRGLHKSPKALPVRKSPQS